MPQLTPSLKALINAPFARTHPRAPPAGIDKVFWNISRDCEERKLGWQSWLAITAAAVATLNSPDSVSILYEVASHSAESLDVKVEIAEYIREVILKCISFNGIPRTINCLNAFRASLPQEIGARLCTGSSRKPTADSTVEVYARGLELWTSIYRPHHDKLLEKLAAAHPDLPVYIICSHYSSLLSDPDLTVRGTLATVGRVRTSLVAISCLRAQTGAGPQLLSHVFGLRKALEDGSYKTDTSGTSDEAVGWMCSDEGNQWILGTVDNIVNAMGGVGFDPRKPAARL